MPAQRTAYRTLQSTLLSPQGDPLRLNMIPSRTTLSPSPMIFRNSSNSSTTMSSENLVNPIPFFYFMHLITSPKTVAIQSLYQYEIWKGESRRDFPREGPANSQSCRM